MNVLLWIVGLIAAVAVLGWLVRRIGQAASGNAPVFRDMPFAVAFGYALGAVMTCLGIWYYLQPAMAEGGVPNPGVTFFRWGVQFLAGSALAAFLFRLAGRHVGPEQSRKLFRSMPLTASYGILVIVIYAVLAIFAAWLAPYGQAEVFDQVNALPGGNLATGGNPDHLLGTDQIGRDLLSRLIYGAQNTVGIAFATTLIAFFLGGSLGFLAAMIQGWFDNALSRMVDVLMAIPSLIFALLLMTIASAWAGNEKWLLTVYMVLIIAVIDSTRVFRLARAVGMNIVVMDYIEAAKLRGERLPYLLFRELLPNAYAPLLAELGLRFCFAFLTIAALSFLGVGIQPPLADWGSMVRDLAQFINFAAFSPLTAALPLMAAGAIALLTVAVNFVVDWMLHRSSGLKD